jgi:dUTP pyrophosphatase
MRVKIKKLHPDAIIPKYATPGAAGFDLVAIEDVAIEPSTTVLIKTGLSFEIPEGYELQIRPRSGTSLRTPLRVANSPGTVDADYRGEVCVIMSNIQVHPSYSAGLYGVSLAQYINKGDRIAQGVICPIIQGSFVEVEELNNTQRGAGGFGSTGV